MREFLNLAILASVALSDGLIFGISVGFVAFKSWLRFADKLFAIRKVKSAPVLGISDLPSVIRDSNSSSEFAESKFERCPESPPLFPPQKGSQDNPLKFFLHFLSRARRIENLQPSNRLVVVNGKILARNVENPTANSGNSLPISIYGDEPAVVIENKTKLFDASLIELLFEFIPPLDRNGSIISRRLTVPICLAEHDEASSPVVIINIENSNQPLPLTTVLSKYHFPPTPSSLIWRLLLGWKTNIGFHEYEGILQLNSELTAVGHLHSSPSGHPELKADPHLPVFLSRGRPEQLTQQLTRECYIQLWLSVAASVTAIGLIALSVTRNWRAWRSGAGWLLGLFGNGDEDMTDSDCVPDGLEDGEQCVICLTRRRNTLFSHCCHRLCCHWCADELLRKGSRCPVCLERVTCIFRLFHV